MINIPASAGSAFSEQPNLLIFQTPIFRKPVYVAPARTQSLRYRIGSSIYGNFAFIPLLLLLLSGLGLYKGLTPELRFSMGVSAVVFLLISIGLLVV
ncbi:hypothetical protein [Cesiribacter andamanensis]|uniref:Uncharacterized protein n=1 Tax=Cesiribacter andamanensis AMV16 TaxID=1279009 RepID=M7NRA9_9BACT|nr:hypothetical protein [Cesiribacter andamanensis]EMR01059.1 hypothetical protein ADICEAN_03807 [Cesiribacter andamanensis AMV16]